GVGRLEIQQARGGAPPGRGLTLEVASQPPGGRVILAGKSMCTTPCRIRDLPRDPVYHLKVSHEGYVTWSSIVDLRGRGGARLTALLRPQPTTTEVGWLSVRSNRLAAIYLNGKETGSVTNEGKIPVKPGRYELTLVHPRTGAKPSAQARIERGSTFSISLP